MKKQTEELTFPFPEGQRDDISSWIERFLDHPLGTRSTGDLTAEEAPAPDKLRPPIINSLEDI